MKTRALKRGAALALILALIAGFFPLVIPPASAASPTTITDEAGLRAISSDLTGDYILGNDIALQSAWTPIGDSTNAFTGTFDGGGFTISGLSINTANTNQGLFARVGAGGTVKNVAVEGTITYTGTASSANIGGIAGQSQGTITNCLNKVNITSGGGKVGGIVGAITANTGTVSNCANSGNITGTGTSGKYAAGIVGHISSGGSVTNCYNTGSIGIAATSAVGTGGVVGYTSGTCTIENCYSSGALTYTASAQVGAIVGWPSTNLTVTNCYWRDESCAAGGFGGTNGEALRTKVSAKTDSEMKLPAFAALLGAEYIADPGSVNGGYPILAWQDSRPKYEVTFNVSPIDAVVTVGALTVSDGGTLQLADDSYSYTAESFGYETASGSFEVSGAPRSVDITLTPQQAQEVTFSVTPSSGSFKAGDPKIIVLHAAAGEQIAASPGVYNLVPETYTYIITASGYQAQTDSFTVEGTDKSVPVTMQALTGEAWDGSANTEPAVKIGDTYYVGTGAELAWFAQQVNAGTGANYNAVLTGDINLGSQEWMPIANYYNVYYYGSFDGQGHAISGLSISSGAGYIGLFGNLGTNGAIAGVSVSGSINTSSSNTGGIVGVSSGAREPERHTAPYAWTRAFLVLKSPPS